MAQHRGDNRAFAGRSRGAADADEWDAGAPPGRGHAVVHDRVSERHTDHVPADHASGPALATSALEALAALQAHSDDPSIDAEPGKIIHELRRGRAADAGSPPTTARWTRRRSFSCCSRRRGADRRRRARPRSQGARAPCADWIDSWGDKDGDGFVEYERRSPRGLLNQSGRTPAIRSASPTVDSPRRRLRPPSAGLRLRRKTSDSQSWLVSCGATSLWPAGSKPRGQPCAPGLTRRSGSIAAAGTTRSRWTATSDRSTPCAPTSVTSSGAASSLTCAPRRSRSGCAHPSWRRVGQFAR